MPKKLPPSVGRVNAAFIRMDAALKKFQAVCVQQGAPISAVTFKTKRGGGSRTHVDYRDVLILKGTKYAA